MPRAIVVLWVVATLQPATGGRRPKCGHGVADAYVKLMRETVLDAVYSSATYKQDGSSRPPASGRNSALTMAGRRRLNNVRDLLRVAVRHGVAGDFVETGSWKGGLSFLAAAVLRSLGELGSRRVWLCDSFRGIPPPIATQKAVNIDKTAWRKGLGNDNSPALARTRATRLGFDEASVRIAPGWFNESLPRLAQSNGVAWRIAVLRLDGDTYFSTLEALEALYDRVPPGGFVVVDDYMDWRGCFEAISDFRRKRDIYDPLVTVYHAPEASGEILRGVYWRKDHSPCGDGSPAIRWHSTDPDLPRLYYSGHHVANATDADRWFFNPVDTRAALHKCARSAAGARDPGGFEVGTKVGGRRA